MADPDGIRDRALGALAAVVAVALGVGVILAAGAYAAAKMVGLTNDTGGHQAASHARPAAASRAPSSTSPSTSAPSSSAPASTPPASRTSAVAGNPNASGQQSPRHPHRHARGHQRHQQQRKHRRHAHHQRHRRMPATGAVTLHAARTRVRPMSRVDLGGRCGCRSGTTLVVQRREHGHWSRFPASATAFHGRFHTWVMTGRRGPNQFRVVLPGGSASKPVTITVS